MTDLHPSPLHVLLEFFRLLRVAGLRVGLTETQDALKGLSVVQNLRLARIALKATLIKRKTDEAVFDRVFDLFFSQAVHAQSLLGVTSEDRLTQSGIPQTFTQGMSQEGSQDNGGAGSGGNSESTHADSEYVQALQRAVQFLLRHVYTPSRLNNSRNVQEALLLLSEMVQKQTQTERSLDDIRADIERVFLQTVETNQSTSVLEGLLQEGDFDDVDFAHMDHTEALLIEAQIERLIDMLMARPRRRNKADPRGHLDLRRTVRKSLQYGGTPVRLARKRRHIETPKVFVLTDISSSVGVFSRFFLMLTRAFQATVGPCRSFVFVDELFEVTDRLQAEMARTSRAGQAVERMLLRIKSFGWTNRRSDYGTTLQQFYRCTVHDIDHRSTIVILGDARSNNAPSQVHALREIHNRVDKVVWLNPERSVLWNTGDSIMRVYAPYCDHLLECRNLAQLRQIVHMLSSVLE